MIQSTNRTEAKPNSVAGDVWFIERPSHIKNTMSRKVVSGTRNEHSVNLTGLNPYTKYYDV